MRSRTKICTFLIFVLVFQLMTFTPHVAAMAEPDEMESKAIALIKRLISQENERDIEAQLQLYADKAEIGGRVLSIHEIQKELKN